MMVCLILLLFCFYKLSDDKFLIPPRAKFHIGNVNFTSKEKIAGMFFDTFRNT